MLMSLGGGDEMWLMVASNSRPTRSFIKIAPDHPQENQDIPFRATINDLSVWFSFLERFQEYS